MADGLTQRAVDYLEQLPEGLDSYPGALAKNAVVRAWVEGHDIERLAATLPESLVPLVRKEVAVSSWIPEAHAMVIYLQVRELFFADDDAYVLDAKERNRQLLAGPLYRIVVSLLSAGRIGKTSRQVFNLMHRGTDLMVDVDRWPWVWKAKFPAYLIPELLGRCYTTAVVAGLELNGQKGVEAVLVEHTPTTLEFSVSFDR